MVALDESGQVIRDALLWNDTRSADAASDLNKELGGDVEIAKQVGSVLVASFTATKLRWLADHEKANAEKEWEEREIISKIDSETIPENWDGLELRQIIKDKAERETYLDTEKGNKSRYKEYKNTVLVYNI